MAEKDDGETQKENSIYEEILDWSKNRPMWQRDALRRIVHGPIGDEDVDEILLLCKQENGLESLSTASLTPVPLAAHHLPSTDPLEDDVVLTGMNDIQNVNAIGSNGLSFSPMGLNIIYGENGAGKSGYARVLKNACRARGSKPVVWPNAFKPSPFGLPSARIDYVEGGASKEFAWAEDASCPPELSRISVFDSKCAPVYVTKDNEVAYLPCGLDILPSLARLCDDIRARLKKESALLMDSQLNGLPEELKGTGAAIWLRNLSHATAQTDVDVETLFSKEEDAELAALVKALNEDNPEKKVAEIKRKAARYEALRSHLISVTEALSEEKTEALKRLYTNYKAAEEAAALASNKDFAAEPLPGVGSETWRALFGAARLYAQEEAYKDESFPSEREDARCVLCQQTLEPPARSRMRRFSDFLADTTATRRDKTLKDLNTTKETLTNFSVSVVDKNLLEELGADDNAIAEVVGAFLRVAIKRRDALLAASASGLWDGVLALPASGEAGLLQVNEKIKAEALKLEAAADPDKTALMKKRRLELKGEKWLSEHKKEIEREVKNKKTQNCLNNAFSSAATRSITDMSDSLTSKHVISRLRTSFHNNFREIYRRNLNVVIEEGSGQKGTAKHGVRLPDLHHKHIKVEEIASEGEAKAIALAAFFAEVSVAPHRSALVLDDPVSSLDHHIIEDVARLLAKAAKDHQVIVFTHNLFFVVELRRVAKELDSKVDLKQVVSDGRGVGMLSSDEPLEILKVSKRITKMRTKLQNAISTYTNIGHDAYRPLAMDLSTMFRETLEKAVEEVLLGDIVQRFERNIHFTKVKKLHQISFDECEDLSKLFNRRSANLHSQSPHSAASIPKPEEFKADIDELENWVKNFQKRRS